MYWSSPNLLHKRTLYIHVRVTCTVHVQCTCSIGIINVCLFCILCQYYIHTCTVYLHTSRSKLQWNHSKVDTIGTMIFVWEVAFTQRFFGNRYSLVGKSVLR